MLSYYGILNKKYDPSTNRIKKVKSIFKLEDVNDFPQSNLMTKFSLYIKRDNDKNADQIFESQRFVFLVHGHLFEPFFDHKRYSDENLLDKFILFEILGSKAKLRGEFCLIIFDKFLNILVCIRDQIGTRPFYYIDNDHSIQIASDINLFRLNRAFSFETDSQWIADSCLQQSKPGCSGTRAKRRIAQLTFAVQALCEDHNRVRCNGNTQ